MATLGSYDLRLQGGVLLKVDKSYAVCIINSMVEIRTAVWKEGTPRKEVVG